MPSVKEMQRKKKKQKRCEAVGICFEFGDGKLMVPAMYKPVNLHVGDRCSLLFSHYERLNFLITACVKTVY